MELTILFLGTGARSPTPRRLVASAMLIAGADHVLVDCGEGTQRQLLRSVAGLRHLDTILISHTHADHVLGMPGLLATMSEARARPLLLAGPVGTGRLVEGFRPHFGSLGFELDLREMAPGESIKRDGYRLDALAAEHRSDALAWALVEDGRRGRLDIAAARARGVTGPDLGRLAAGEDVDSVLASEVMGPPQPGRRVVLSGDTAPAVAIEAASRGADVLVHDATFLERDRELAAASGHSTAAQAAALAGRAGVRLLALTHRSQRYRTAEVLEEARSRFARTVAPQDLDVITVPVPGHGRPELRAGAGRSEYPRGVESEGLGSNG